MLLKTNLTLHLKDKMRINWIVKLSLLSQSSLLGTNHHHVFGKQRTGSMSLFLSFSKTEIHPLINIKIHKQHLIFILALKRWCWNSSGKSLNKVWSLTNAQTCKKWLWLIVDACAPVLHLSWIVFTSHINIPEFSIWVYRGCTRTKQYLNTFRGRVFCWGVREEHRSHLTVQNELLCLQESHQTLLSAWKTAYRHVQVQSVCSSNT